MTDKLEIPNVGTLYPEFEIPSFKAMILEDDDDAIHVTEEALKRHGVDQVHVAKTIGEAERLESDNEYDAYFVDVLLQPWVKPDERRDFGDRWLLQKLDERRETLKVVLTGNYNEISDLAALKGQNISVVRKGDEEEELVYQRLGEFARKRKLEQVIETLEGRLRPGESERGPILQRAIADLFTQWAETRRNKDSRMVWYGGKPFTIEQLGAEVQKGSEIGNIFLALFVRHISRKLGLSPPP